MRLDLAILTFPSQDGAERAFADVRDSVREAPWLNEVAFVYHRWDGRMEMRGVLAGRYVDIAEEGDVIGPDTAVGALTGALVGALFGPPGFAAGLVTGAAAGGVIQSHEAELLHDALVDELRATVEEGESALLLLAEPQHVDQMLEAFGGTGARMTRHTLSNEQVAALQKLVMQAPPAAGVTPGEGQTERHDAAGA
jgi:uncharacterized membrane protein